MTQKTLFFLFFILSSSCPMTESFPRLCCCCKNSVLEFQEPTLIPAEKNPITLPSIEKALHELETADSSTLVFFDIDDTIIENCDPTFQTRFHKSSPYCRRLFEDFSYKGTQKGPFWMSHFLTQQKKQLVEPAMADFIHTLQKKGALVLAISAFSAGCYGHIEDSHANRKNELDQVGISFQAPSCINTRNLNNFFKRLFKSQSVVLKDGIISSAGYSKGLLISFVISEINTPLKKILFFDDQYKNHEDVIFYVEEDMPLSSYHYTAAHTIRPKDACTEKIAQAQFEAIYKENRYVSYHEIAMRMLKETSPSQSIQEIELSQVITDTSSVDNSDICSLITRSVP